MEEKSSRGVVNNVSLHTRSRTFPRCRVTQTLPLDSASNDPNQFTQLIDHDSVANICGGDTLGNNTAEDEHDDDEMSGDTEVLADDDDDDDDACGNDVQSVVKQDDTLLESERNSDLSLTGKNEISPSRKHGLHGSIKGHGGANFAKIHEVDLFKYDSDATMQEEEEEEKAECEDKHNKDEERTYAITACIKTAIEYLSEPKEDKIPDIDESRDFKLHDEDNHVTLNSTPKPNLVLGSCSGKDSPVTLCASGSRPKSIASVRAASLRASGLRAAMENVRSVSFSKADTLGSRPDKDDDKKDFVATTHELVPMGVNDETLQQTFDFIGTEIVHDTSQVCDISLAQTPPKMRTSLDNTNICSPRMSTSRPKPKSDQLRAQSRQKARKLVFDSKEELPVLSDYRLEKSDEKLGHRSFQVDQNKQLDLSPLESALNAPTNSTYLESQEPGEESQLNALGVVDKLICLDVACTPQEEGKSDESMLFPGEGNWGNSGRKSFAQAAQMKAVHEKMDVFDWIDSQADEGSPLPAKGSDKGKQHSKQLGDTKLIPSMENQFINCKSNQNNNDEKMVESNIQAESAISDAVFVESSAMAPVLMKNLESSSSDQGVKMRTLLTTRLKNSVLESLSCKRKFMPYSKRKSETRKNRKNNSESLSARSVQKQKSNGVNKAKEVIDIIPTENVKAKESELSCVIQTAEGAGLETDVLTPVKTSKKRNLLSGNATKTPRKKRNIQPARTIKLRGRKVSSVERTVDSAEDLIMEEGKVESTMKMGPKSKSNVPDFNSKWHDKRGKSTATMRNYETPTSLNNNNEEGITLIECNRKRKAVSACSSEALKEKTETDTALPKRKFPRTSNLAKLDTDILISYESRDEAVNRTAVQKAAHRRPKQGIHSEIKEQTKGMKTEALCMKNAYEGQNVKPNTQVNRTARISENVSNSNNSVLLDERRRPKRNPSCIHVLFSHSLPEEITKHQKKILAKLGGHIATSASSCTHFISNNFVRTRNMLVSMASGKVVATPQWLESCCQAHYFVDEKKYILQDEKKERELGFSMHSSLAAARRKPLLKGLHIVVTPNTTPDPETMKEIIETAGGQVVQDTLDFLQSDASQEGRLVVADAKDYEYCLPFFEKGFRVYSTELILHSIVTQSLDFSRNQILQRRNTRKSGKTNVKHK